jgi:hypothetical protein
VADEGDYSGGVDIQVGPGGEANTPVEAQTGWRDVLVCGVESLLEVDGSESSGV